MVTHFLGQYLRRTTIMFQLLCFKPVICLSLQAFAANSKPSLLYYRNSSTLLPQTYPILIINELHSYGTKMFPQFE